MHDNSAFTILVDESGSGRRLDQFIASRIPVPSRAAAANLIRNGNIQVDYDTELTIEGDAVVNMTDGVNNGSIQCDGLLRVKDNAQLSW